MKGALLDRSVIEELVRSALREAFGDARAQEPVDSGDSLTIPSDRGTNLSPADPAALSRMLSAQPARIAVGRTGLGTRYCTSTLLRFRADHAAAKDAVTSEVDAKLLEKLGFPELRSRATDKKHFLLRPDAGRALSDESAKRVQELVPHGTQLCLIYGDGLSSMALNEHLEVYHRALLTELGRLGIKCSPPFFVRWSRVKIMDQICQLTGAEAGLFICGERPGLGFADSMSAYYIYRPAAGATDANREVISNINPRGVEPSRAAKQTAEAIQRILREQKSGVMPA